MCEGVGDDSTHRIGHVDIQVGSYICLNVFMLNHGMCTSVGSNPCRIIQLMGIAHLVEGTLFQVQGCSGRRRSLEAALRRKLHVALVFIL